MSRLVPYGDVLQGAKVRGSAIYIAPEVAQGQGVDHTADVYAFGISLYEFIERKIPFSHHVDIKTFLQAVVLDMERPVLSDDPLLVPKSLRALCEECWAADKTQRPTFVDLIQRFPAVLTDCAIFDEVRWSAATGSSFFSFCLFVCFFSPCVSAADGPEVLEDAFH